MDAEESSVVNSMDRSDLEVIAFFFKVLAQIFGDLGGLAKTSTLLEQLAVHIHFHVEVVSQRRDVESGPKPSSQSQSSNDSKSSKGTEKEGQKNKLTRSSVKKSKHE